MKDKRLSAHIAKCGLLFYLNEAICNNYQQTVILKHNGESFHFFMNPLCLFSFLRMSPRAFPCGDLPTHIIFMHTAHGYAKSHQFEYITLPLTRYTRLHVLTVGLCVCFREPQWEGEEEAVSSLHSRNVRRSWSVQVGTVWNLNSIVQILNTIEYLHLKM